MYEPTLLNLLLVPVAMSWVVPGSRAAVSAVGGVALCSSGTAGSSTWTGDSGACSSTISSASTGTGSIILGCVSRGTSITAAIGVPPETCTPNIDGLSVPTGFLETLKKKRFTKKLFQ